MNLNATLGELLDNLIEGTPYIIRSADGERELDETYADIEVCRLGVKDGVLVIELCA